MTTDQIKSQLKNARAARARGVVQSYRKRETIKHLESMLAGAQ